MNKRNLASVIIATLLVGVLISQIKLVDIVSTIKNISPIWLIFGFILYILGYFYRAVRFHILLDRKISIKELFFIVSFHNMTNNLLPARTGEFSYIFLVKKNEDVSTVEGIATLAIARVLDFLAIAIIFIISSFFVFREMPSSLTYFPVLLIISMLFVVLALYLLVYHGEDTIDIIESIASNFGIQKNRLFSSLLKKGNELHKEFLIIKSRKKIIIAFLASLLIWGFNYLVVYILINDLGIRMGLWGAMFCNTFAVLTSILPIQGIGGFGTREGGWTIGFVMLGVSLDTAISASFAIHFVILAYFMTLGTLSIKIFRHT